MTWAELLIEFNCKYYNQAIINSKVAKFTRLQQGSMSVLEYVRQFDQPSQYAPDMVQTEMSKDWRFLRGLHLSLAGLVDTRRDGPESYADVVGRVIQQESCIKTENSVILSAGEGLKEATQPSPLQVYGNK